MPALMIPYDTIHICAQGLVWATGLKDDIIFIAINNN